MSDGKEDFFKKDAPHGLVKRIMLKKYVQAYVAKILNTEFKQYPNTKHDNTKFEMILIDGFAGAGRIDDYGPNGWAIEIEKYGSPMIILLAVLEYLYEHSHQRKRTQKEWTDHHKAAVKELADSDGKMDRQPRNDPFNERSRIHLFFVEKNPEYYLRLVDGVFQYLHSFFRQINGDAGTRIAFSEMPVENKTFVQIQSDEYPIECTIVNGEFNSFVPPRNRAESNGFVYSRRLTFLDPYGYSQTPMDHVREFLDDEYSEVFINFMSSFVNRFVSRQPEAVARLYGIKLPNEDNQGRRALGAVVRYIIRLHQNEPTENGRNCSRSYISHMKEQTNAVNALMFEMRGPRNHLIYHMIHFSNHLKGLEAMKESMNTCSQDEDTFKMSDYKVMAEGIPLHIGNSQKDEVVANYVFSEFRGSRKVDMKVVEEFVWKSNTPFVFRKGIIKVLEMEYKPRLIKVEHSARREFKRTRQGTYPDLGEGSWLLTFRDTDEAEKWRQCGDTATDQSAQDESAVADKVFEEFHGQTVPLEDIERFVQGILRFEKYKQILKIFETEDGPNPRLMKIEDAKRSQTARRKGTYPAWGEWRFSFRSKEEACDGRQASGPSGSGAGDVEPQASFRALSI